MGGNDSKQVADKINFSDPKQNKATQTIPKKND
jgi:hypothetical protein